MSAEPDPAAVVASVADAVVRELACICALDVVERGQLERVRVVHADPDRQRFGTALDELAPELKRPTCVPQKVFETRRPCLIRRLTPLAIDAIAVSERARDLILLLDPTSMMSVPLIGRGQVIGVLTLISRRPDRLYDEADLALAEQVAARVALAVDNARLYAEARRAITTRGEVLAIVAHDLRNPLNGILMQLHAMQKSDSVEDECREPLAAIAEAAQRMNRLIQDLLDVSRLESGPLPVRLGVIQPAQVILECTRGLRAYARDLGVELVADADPRLPELVADHRRLVQALENLVSNAIKFTTPRGTVLVGARYDGANVVFSVRDDGCGIAPEDLPRVFDRFWQADRSDRRGTGLGLAIVKDVVEGHGSRVHVKSVRGVGTTFTFALPCAAESTAERSLAYA